MLIEKLLKVLDYFTKEKVVRAFLLLFDSLSSSKKCLEIMSDLSCTEIFSRLQQRNWAEKESVEMLDNLWELLDQNYQEFTSIGKFAKEVHNRSLRWSPIHTTRFWQENFIHFNDKDNLDLIKVLVDILDMDVKEEKARITVAIALFDLGEFAKYFNYGRSYLDKLLVKPKIYKLMQKSDD